MNDLSDVFNALITDSGLSTKEFSKRSKVKQPNVVTYKKRIGKRALLKACENYFGWPVMPIREISKFDGDFSDIPEVGGLYVFYDSAGSVVYFGKATNLKTEARQTYNRKSSFHTRFGPNLKKNKHTFGSITSFISLYKIDSPHIRKNFEALLLRVFPNQTHNHNLGNFS